MYVFIVSESLDGDGVWRDSVWLDGDLAKGRARQMAEDYNKNFDDRKNLVPQVLEDTDDRFVIDRFVVERVECRTNNFILITHVNVCGVSFEGERPVVPESGVLLEQTVFGHELCTPNTPAARSLLKKSLEAAVSRFNDACISYREKK